MGVRVTQAIEGRKSAVEVAPDAPTVARNRDMQARALHAVASVRRLLGRRLPGGLLLRVSIRRGHIATHYERLA
jgi:hypothetical protein